MRSRVCPTFATSSSGTHPIADVRALPGIRYRLASAGNPTTLVAPPYDVISASDVTRYEALSPFNVVHLTRPGTDYERAARKFEEWERNGILQADEPSMYVHEVAFNGRRRRDLIAALRLQPYEDRVVLPHERTHRGPKEDRLALMRATKVSLEPLWFVYEGRASGVQGVTEVVSKRSPAVAFAGPDGFEHRLWTITDRVIQAAVHASFTLALLTDIDDPGLEVLPTHRVLKVGVAVTGGEDVPSLAATLSGLHDRVAAGAYHDHRFQVLPLEGNMALVELHKQVIDNILGKRDPEQFLLYTRDPNEAVRWVDEGVGVGAYFLDAPDLKQVLKLAQEGKTLPQKSTYFYPKPPSGMVFLRLDPNRRL